MDIKQGFKYIGAGIVFESSVKLYGYQTKDMINIVLHEFESSVKLYGYQTFPFQSHRSLWFESSVKLYGYQTLYSVL